MEICEQCPHIFSDVQTDPPLGHDFPEEGTVVTEMTCTIPETRRFACQLVSCREAFTESTEAPGHQWCDTGYVFSASSCTQTGTRRFPCLRLWCNDEKSEDIPRHDYNDFGVCRTGTCGHIRDAQPGHFQYFMFRGEHFANYVGTDYWECYVCDRISPTNSTVCSFGTCRGRLHLGLDIRPFDGSSVIGYPIYAQGSGTILRNDPDMSDSAGWFIVIKYDNGLTVRYLHLHERPNRLLLAVGKPVDHTTPLGHAGNSRLPNLPNGSQHPGHLHYDINTSSDWNGDVIRDNNSHVNPRNYFPTGIFR
jgi:hypothetical protein